MKIFAAAALATMLATTAVQADNIEVGRLSCTVDGGIGLIFGSSKDITCDFHRDDESTESYSGEINKLGIDIGITGTTRIEWLVFTDTTADEYVSGALAGTYVGITAEATFGVGLGANALIGGSREAFALQPFSVQAQTGFNLAAGLASLTLR